MDLVILVLVIAVIGFLVYLITTQIPMDPIFIWAIRILCLVVLVVYLIRHLGASVPNVLH